MAAVDYELLKEDLNFPLQPDAGGYHVYIWDNENSMVANIQIEDRKAIEVIEERVCTGLRKFKEEDYNGMYELLHGYIIHKQSDKPVLLVRGWGRLQYKDDPELRQDNIANYLLNCMNFNNNKK